MGAMQPWHWLVVILVFMLLFGSTKLPQMARSLGQSARIFKSEIKGMQADDEARERSAPPAALPPTTRPPTTGAAAPPEPTHPPATAGGPGDPDPSR